MTRHLIQRPTRGQALSEFALVLPILLLFLVGLLDVGRAVFAYNSVSNAARSATRVAIVDQTPSAIQSAAESEAVGLNPIQVVVTYEPACTTLEIGCLATVAVEHQWTAATPIIGWLLGSITVASDAKMPIERVHPAPVPSP